MAGVPGTPPWLWCAAADRREAFVEETLIDPARRMYLHRARHLPASSPYRFADARDVPADLALPVFLHVPLEVTDGPEVLSSTALLCAHMQHLPVERFFLPPGAARAATTLRAGVLRAGRALRDRGHRQGRAGARGEGPGAQRPLHLRQREEVQAVLRRRRRRRDRPDVTRGATRAVAEPA
ncbi:MAG: hypothetical protein Q8M65_01785 [Rhodoglobus sp.]|nr:hypothetical protein [Rhodoglobus sp.]